MGEPAGLPGPSVRARAEGAGVLESVSLVSDQGSSSSSCPRPRARPSLARVCVTGKGRLRVDFSPSSCICFSVGVCVSHAASPFPARGPSPSVPPLSSETCHQLPPPLTHPPTHRKEGQPPPSRQRGPAGVRVPLTGAGQAADSPAPGPRGRRAIQTGGPSPPPEVLTLGSSTASPPG